MKINDNYSIKCYLYNGNYKYVLYEDGRFVSSMIDKSKPYDLSRKGKIVQLLKKMNYPYSSVSDFKAQKNKDLDKVIEELEISLKPYEIDFDEYQQTNFKLYNKRGSIIFNFGIVSVKFYDEDFYIIKIKNNLYEKVYEGSIDELLYELNNEYLINTNVGNYKFIFKTLISLIYERCKNDNSNRY